MSSAILKYVKEGFVQGRDDLGSKDQSVRSARRSYRLKVYSEFLEYLLENKDVVDDYTEYLMSQKTVDTSERDNSRLASKKQKKALPNRCVLCEGPVSEYHHIVPHSAGGSTKEANLLPLCSSCHRCLGFAEVIAVDMIEEAADKFL